MGKIKYMVCRDDIYVGEVIKINDIHSNIGELIDIKTGKLSIHSWKSYRSILFTLDENQRAFDLLYTTPNYPVINVTNNNASLNLEKDNIVIQEPCNISSLLKYFGYASHLTIEDIIKIRKTFFNGRFAKDNCNLFGFKEIMAEDLTFYLNGEKIIASKKIEKFRQDFRKQQKTGYRMFSKIEEGILPEEYWTVLDTRGNNTLIDILDGSEEKIDTFAPHREEGPIKKLTRF